jgi:glycosyltransferase involved in cell wall biosynthesis
MLPFFFRHYDSIVSRYFIFDNGSTDRSIELLHAHPKVSFNRLEAAGESVVLAGLPFYNQAWKNSRGQADWVIVCDPDEHLEHFELGRYLADSRDRDSTIIPSVGYQMIADDFPETAQRLADVVRTGMRWEPMDKTTIFNPDAIEEIGFAPGRHKCAPQGELKYGESVRLLHYKYLGLDYLKRRLAELGERLRPGDIIKNYGHKYRWTEAQVEHDFAEVRSRAEVLD